MAALTAALIGTTAAAGALSAVSSHKQAKAAQSQGAYEGALAERNATLAEQQAGDATVRGDEGAHRQRGATRQLIGTQRTGLAAQGIALDDGSALDLQTDAAALGELDALTIRNNARREAWGFRVQAADSRARGALAVAAGANIANAHRAQATGTLLTTGAEIASMSGGGKK